MDEPDSVTFLGLNLLLIAGVGLLIFIYLVLLIRKRWKANFLHPLEPRKEEEQQQKK